MQFTHCPDGIDRGTAPTTGFGDESMTHRSSRRPWQRPLLERVGQWSSDHRSSICVAVTQNYPCHLPLSLMRFSPGVLARAASPPKLARGLPPLIIAATSRSVQYDQQVPVFDLGLMTEYRKMKPSSRKGFNREDHLQWNQRKKKMQAHRSCRIFCNGKTGKFSLMLSQCRNPKSVRGK